MRDRYIQKVASLKTIYLTSNALSTISIEDPSFNQLRTKFFQLNGLENGDFI